MSEEPEGGGAGGGAGSGPCPAGDFSAWLRLTRAALLHAGEAVVACGDCHACCAAAQFIRVRPDEVHTLARIPRGLSVPAPGGPRGHRMIVYDGRGACPMLARGACSIYEDRPRTCRSYDCRVFAAAGIDAGEGPKAAVSARARRWVFSYPTAGDEIEHRAVRAAARFVLDHAASFPGGRAPTDPSQVAVLALTTYELFLGEAPAPPAERAAAMVELSRRFEARVAHPPA